MKKLHPDQGVDVSCVPRNEAKNAFCAAIAKLLTNTGGSFVEAASCLTY
jgi:hypothetical protein